jgi:hypothetical protein
MKKSLLILVLTALSACSSTETAPDEFTTISEEWQGGNIQDMIDVWGDPKTLKQAGADGDEGPAKTVNTKSHPNDRNFLRSRCTRT